MNQDFRQHLVNHAQFFYSKNWMVGTAGNLSARAGEDSFWITASGKNKGELTLKDFIRVSLEGTILEQPNPENKPSAETSIHQAIYRQISHAQACYHVHSVEANLVSLLTNQNKLRLPAIEMLKGLGIWQEHPQIDIPIFENHFLVPQIAAEIEELFQLQKPVIPALLIRSHGVTVWADSPTTARNYIEIIEYIFRYLIAAQKLQLTEF